MMDPNTHQLKRPRPNDPDSSSDSDTENDSSVPPRFLVVHATDASKPLKSLSPFAISKAIEGVAGPPKNVQRLRSGDLLVEVERQAHAKNLLSCKMFVNVPVVVTAHKTLNYKKGVVNSRDLAMCSEEELTRELKPQGVTEVHRITVKLHGGNTRQTNTFILTFTGDLPTAIKAGFVRVPVRPYIPNPLRCFKCQRYEHGKNSCQRDAVCSHCGERQEDHSDSVCSNAAHCINCNGDHSADSKDCPRWKIEKQIQEYKVKNGVSFTEARKTVEQQTVGPSGRTYAEVAKPVSAPSMCSVGTQTDATVSDHSRRVVFVYEMESSVSTSDLSQRSGKQSSSQSSSSSSSAQKQKKPGSVVTPSKPTKEVTKVPAPAKAVSSKPTNEKSVSETGKPKPKDKNRQSFEKPTKASNNPVSQTNKYAALDEDDMDCDFDSSQFSQPRKK